MKTYRTETGPLREKPFYNKTEIERICEAELKRVRLFPNSPEPVRIDAFIKRRFNVTPDYQDLPEGVLAYTRFGPTGVTEMVVSRTLGDDLRDASRRRLNATLAHECGHGLLHAHLFAVEDLTPPLFGEPEERSKVKVLCRQEHVEISSAGSDRWWEYQANLSIGPLLLPRAVVEHSVRDFLVPRGSLGHYYLPDSTREKASRTLAEIFDVNPVVARIRIASLYPQETERQMAL